MKNLCIKSRESRQSIVECVLLEIPWIPNTIYVLIFIYTYLIPSHDSFIQTHISYMTVESPDIYPFPMKNLRYPKNQNIQFQENDWKKVPLLSVSGSSVRGEGVYKQGCGLITEWALVSALISAHTRVECRTTNTHHLDVFTLTLQPQTTCTCTLTNKSVFINFS